MNNDFIVGDLVAYTGLDDEGKIYKIMIGKIKRNMYKLNDYVTTKYGISGLIIKIYRPTGSIENYVHIKLKTGKVWYCPCSDISNHLYIKHDDALMSLCYAYHVCNMRNQKSEYAKPQYAKTPSNSQLLKELKSSIESIVIGVNTELAEEMESVHAEIARCASNNMYITTSGITRERMDDEGAYYNPYFKERTNK